MNSLSGGYFVTGAESLFDNRLLRTLAASAPNINPNLVLATGATDIHHVFSGADLTAVLNSYMAGIKDVFAWSLAGAAFTAVLPLLVPLKKMPPVDDIESEKTEEKSLDDEVVGENEATV